MKAETVPAAWQFDQFELDEADARLTRAGKTVPLAPKPFAVLCTLARTPGRLLTKNELLDIVWGHRFVTNASLKSAISELRAALEDDSKRPRYIQTVAKRGYRFIAVTVAVAADVPRAAVPPAGSAGIQPGYAALAALCRADAALAGIIRKVAASLEGAVT